mmetsp:Transcript_26340/g.61438  ORF Transcript_26340/g.61438 Transcript_26340/m.61438 type:complete len:327 (+) Transcript_26340:172-1152(+)
MECAHGSRVAALLVHHDFPVPEASVSLLAVRLALAFGAATQVNLASSQIPARLVNLQRHGLVSIVVLQAPFRSPELLHQVLRCLYVCISCHFRIGCSVGTVPEALDAFLRLSNGALCALLLVVEASFQLLGLVLSPVQASRHMRRGLRTFVAGPHHNFRALLLEACGLLHHVSRLLEKLFGGDALKLPRCTMIGRRWGPGRAPGLARCPQWRQQRLRGRPLREGGLLTVACTERSLISPPSHSVARGACCEEAAHVLHLSVELLASFGQRRQLISCVRERFPLFVQGIIYVVPEQLRLRWSPFAHLEAHHANLQNAKLCAAFALAS